MGNEQPLVTWPLLTQQKAVATILLTVERENTAPLGILTIVGSLSLARLALLVGKRAVIIPADIPWTGGLILAVLATITILNMPLRSPASPSSEICGPYEVPTHDLRSPEDNLTPWQFMTVSWMSSLISIGSARQLNEEDVWSLAFEFQHKALHETFRTLQGSVVRRLLAANGLDLIIIGSLAILECAASKYPSQLRLSLGRLKSFQGSARLYSYSKSFVLWRILVSPQVTS